MWCVVMVMSEVVWNGRCGVGMVECDVSSGWHVVVEDTVECKCTCKGCWLDMRVQCGPSKAGSLQRNP